MLLQKSKSIAQSAERPVLAPSWLIVLMASIVGVSLWLLYPRQALERRIAEAPDTALSVAYLNNLLRSEPNNPRLRLLLAQRQITVGDLSAARITLKPALESTDKSIHRDALWSLWDLFYAELAQVPEKEVGRRNAILKSIKEQLKVVERESWSPERQLLLSRRTADLEVKPVVASALPPAPPEPLKPVSADKIYARAAVEALWKSDYQHAAEMYLKARSATSDRKQEKIYFMDAVGALQSGNQPVAALKLAEREIGDLASDKDVLLMVTNLARAAGKPSVADKYVRRLLKLSQTDPKFGSLNRVATIEEFPSLLIRTSSRSVAPNDQTHRYDDGAYLLAPPTLEARRQPADAAPMRWGLVKTAEQAKASSRPESPELPFDDQIYDLGYRVFLENGKLSDAWSVAKAATKSRPNDLKWRERLAQVSDWTQRPNVALENWLYIARHTDDEAAWQSVLRLAPGQFDDASLVLAIRHQLLARPDDSKLIHALVEAQERIGEPQPALDYLQKHANSESTIELLATLAERAGQPKLALESWQRLFRDKAQITPGRAMRAAVLALTHGHPDEGLQWLEAAQQQQPETPAKLQTDFWRLTAQLAESRQRRNLAVGAYRRLIATDESDTSDYDALVQLLNNTDPIEAAAVSVAAWERFDQPRHLVDALSLYAREQAWGEFPHLLNLLDQHANTQRHSLANLRKIPEFLRLVGRYYENVGKPQEARRYYEAGLQLTPDSSEMREAVLWLLIDSNDSASLRTLLVERESAWSKNESLHDSLAAAYQSLSLPRIALERYLTPHLKTHQKDFLWLMNYADALDQDQRTDRAWSLRRSLLSREWESARTGKDGRRLTRPQAEARWLTQDGLDEARRIARARLVITQMPGDSSIEILRELLRMDTGGREKFSNAAAETAIGWLQDAGEYSAERSFLRHQYARSRGAPANQPLWAEITLALGQDDKAETGQLIERFGGRLPRYDRVNAARVVGDIRLAQTAAFEAQSDQRDDQPLQEQLSENLLAFSDYARGGVRFDKLGGLDESRGDTSLHIGLNPRISLDLNAFDVNRRVTDPAAVSSPPDEHGIDGTVKWMHPNGMTRARIGSHQSFATYTPIQLYHVQKIGSQLSLELEFGNDLPSEESLPLRIAGMKRRAGASIRYQGTGRDRFGIGFFDEHYELQTGAALGAGQHTLLDYTHTYRQDGPGIEFGAFWSRHTYSRNDPNAIPIGALDFRQLLPPASGAPGKDYFLPDNFNYYGISASANLRQETDYTRAAVPFATVSRTWHSVLGPGYDVRIGLAGSVLGADHIAMSWGVGKSGIQVQGLTRSVQITYRLHF